MLAQDRTIDDPLNYVYGRYQGMLEKAARGIYGQVTGRLHLERSTEGEEEDSAPG